jgi:cell division protein FtsI/penicillin-binding protein 2
MAAGDVSAATSVDASGKTNAVVAKKAAGSVYYQSDGGRSNRLICENEQVSGLAKASGAAKGATPALFAVTAMGSDAKSIEAMPLNDPRWSVPPSLDLILRPLDALRQPGSQLYQDYTDREARGAGSPEQHGYGRNTVNLGGAILDVGFSVDLAIDPIAQAYAQQIAACYTGSQQVCRALGVHRSEDEFEAKPGEGKSGQAKPGQPKSGPDQPIGHKLQENAVVRMAGIAIIDIASGRIEAVAGAMSHCAWQDDDGPGRGPECDNRLPWQPAFRRDLLENPALFHESMPASTIKPIMAAAFLTDGDYGKHLLAQELAADRLGKPPAAGLRFELMRSDSARFLDRMFCKEKGYANCERPWRVQRMAQAMGWNTACGDRFDCGRRDVLFGRAPDYVGENGLLVPSSSMAMFGRLLTEPIDKGRKGEDKRFHLMPQRELDAAKLRLCALGKDMKPITKDDWNDCRAGYTSQVVHEGWGQSDARASPVGVAGMMAMLGAAANGAAALPAPHLVEDLRGVGNPAAGKTGLMTAEQRLDLSPPLPVGVPQQVAQVILSGMNWSHRGGTATYACEQLWGRKACNDIDWIAGKTGTPSFHNDYKTLDTIARDCRNGDCSSLRPYKWYAGVFRLGDGPGWNKAIAVLTERGWLKGNGPVYGAGDLGPNPAAEIGLQVARCLRDNPAGKDKGVCRG